MTNSRKDSFNKKYLGRKKLRITGLSKNSAFYNDKWLIGSTGIADIYQWNDTQAYCIKEYEIDQTKETQDYDRLPIIFEVDIDILDDTDIPIEDKKASLAARSQGDQVFSVPNTSEGRIFLELAAKYLNTKKYTRRNRTRGAYDGIPMAECNWIAVYIRRKDTRPEYVNTPTIDELVRVKKLELQIADYEAQIAELKETMVNIANERDTAESLLDDFKTVLQNILD